MPGSGITLPLNLHAIAARCTNAYYAPKVAGLGLGQTQRPPLTRASLAPTSASRRSSLPLATRAAAC